MYIVRAAADGPQALLRGGFVARKRLLALQLKQSPGPPATRLIDNEAATGVLTTLPEVVLARLRRELEADGVGTAIQIRFNAVAAEVAAELAAAPLEPFCHASSLLCDVRRVELATSEPPNVGLTWESAYERAAAIAGGRLPTREQLLHARAGEPLERRDVWLPVRRTDGVEGDWCGPNNERPGSYNSHLDRHRSIPGWGADCGGHGHIPGTHASQLRFFFVAVDDKEASAAAMLRRFVARHRAEGALQGASDALCSEVEGLLRQRGFECVDLL